MTSSDRNNGFRPADTSFFGHPKGLGFLAGTEMWERFSFHGMQALLMLYMTQYLLEPSRSARVFGLTPFRNALSWVFGSMSDLAFASQTFGLYAGLIYVTPLIGAWLGDRAIGRTKSVVLGATLMSAGHLLMASESMFLCALTLLILGSGCLTGNMAAQVGLLYEAGDERRARAFGLYLVALNIGVLLSPLVCGTLGEMYGWHWGFAAAGAGMVIGLATYMSGRHFLPPDVIIRKDRSILVTKRDWKRVGVILLALVPYALVSAMLLQAYSLVLVWADKAVDRHAFGRTIPVTWVLTFDGIMTILGILLATRLWKRMADRGVHLQDVTKLAIGCLGITLAFVYLGRIATLQTVPFGLWLGFYILVDTAIGWIEPPTASMVSRNAPVALNATMMSVFKLARAFSYFFLGWLGKFIETIGASNYWLLSASIAAVAFVFAAILSRNVARLLPSDGDLRQEVAEAGN